MSNQQNPIRVYDTSITLVGELDNYANAYFTRSWYGAGGFAIQMNANMPHAEDLQKGYIVMFARDKYRCGIITQLVKEVDENGKGGEVITASGFELAYIFSWRIILPLAGDANYTLSDSAEAVMKQLLKDQCGSTADADRQISILDIATDQGRGSNYVMNIRYNETVLDELTKVAKSTNIGYFVYLDETNKKIIFEISQGVDRTATQTTNPRAIFSSDYDTLRQASISSSDNQYRNYAYVAGQGIGAARTIREVYSTTTEPTGLDRKELYVDARDLSVAADLDARGEQRLEEFNIQLTVEGMPLTYSPLVYRVDYDVGDIVTIEAYGESVDQRITEIKESWAPLSYDISATFGKEPFTLQSQVNSAVGTIKQALNAVEV